MTYLKAIKDFGISDDQILNVIILHETRKMEAAKALKSMLFDKWNLTTLEAHNIIEALKKELSL